VKKHMRMMRKPGIALSLVLGLAIAAVGMASGITISAQAQKPCELLASDEIQALAPQQQVGNGVASTSLGLDSSTCRYSWGEGTGRYALAISISPASRMFAGLSADAIKQSLVKAVVPETSDESIPDVGEAAVFKSSSSVYATASAYLKDRVLQVTLDGIDARDRKAQVIALLKSAASRL
jgi:hypothetical protein